MKKVNWFYPQIHFFYIKIRKTSQKFSKIKLYIKSLLNKKMEVFPMTNFTTNSYEMKRDLINFSKKITNGISKPEEKFIMDMLFGISKSSSTLISEISRGLKEDINLGYTIERLCNHLSSFSNEKTIMTNYYNECKDYLSDEPIVLFDDSDITKIYGKKFEDLDRVVDGSSLTTNIKPGYHVCEAVVLGKNEKQPISLYSKIYSTKRKNFDRGYDSNQIINYMDETNNGFVIRMNDKRNFLFKGNQKNAYKEALKRKGKIRMELWFDNKEVHEVYISHTKVTMPFNKKNYELVFCYGLSEERPLILLTNLDISSKEDVIKVVRLYFSRWRIEER